LVREQERSFLLRYLLTWINSFYLDCDESSSSSVTDRICPTGGDYACRFYCFLTTGSFVGHCDDSQNCICGTPGNIQNKNENSDQEIIIIVEN